MYNLKIIIFETYFPKFFTTNDYNKDVNGKGFLQRFTETLAQDWDETVISVALNLLDNTLIPATVLDKFIPYLEEALGMPVVHPDLVIRRRVLQRTIEIYKHKGTLRSYQLIFNALGFDNVEILQAGIDFGFDSSVTFDDEVRTFDLGRCHKCKYYRLNLIGDVVIDNTMYQAIRKAVKVVEPIYCRLFDIRVNGVEADLLTIFIDTNGDLIYTTMSEALVGFTLAPNGDLHIYGSDAAKYYIDNNGNMIYNGY